MSRPRSRGWSTWRSPRRLSPNSSQRAAERPAELALVGPASAQLYAACALARGGPLLVVTATGREADDLTAELRGVFGDAAAMFPSWETLPHERLSPGVDTVGARLMVLRRLAHPDDARLGPAAAGGGDHRALAAAADGARPGRHRTGDPDTSARSSTSTTLVARPGRAGLHPRRHGRQARRVRRPRRHPRRLPADRRAPGPGGVLGRRGHRDADVRGRRPALDPRDRRRAPWSRCPAASCCSPTRCGPAPPSSSPTRPPDDNHDHRQRRGHAGQARRGHSRSTAWRRCSRCCGPTSSTLLIDHLPDGHPAAGVRPGEGAHPGRRPDQDRPRVPGSVVVGGRDRR